MNTFKLEGKNAIITGGLGGYGLAIAGLILKRGGRVLLADIIPEKEAEVTLQSRFPDAVEAKTILYTICDVSSEAQIEAAFSLAHEKLTLADSSVDILINGAGIVGEQNWKKLFEINIVSVIFEDNISLGIPCMLILRLTIANVPTYIHSTRDLY